MAWMNAPKGQPRSVYAKDHVKGTCEWVESKNSFQNWRQAEGSAGLWIVGKPGKSHSFGLHEYFVFGEYDLNIFYQEWGKRYYQTISLDL